MRKSSTDNIDDVKAMELMAKKREEADLSIREIDECFLNEGETYNLHICLEKAQIYQEQMASGMIGLGKQLVLIKSHEEHGNFMAAIEQLGLAHTSANYAMAAARKFGNSRTFGNLGSTKIQVLTVLDDDSIKKLDEGGEVEGVGSLDAIERMTVRELKTALRKEKDERKKEREAQESVIDTKNSKLNEMEQQLRYQQPPTKADLAGARIEEIQKKFWEQVCSADSSIRLAIRVLDEIQELDGIKYEQIMAFSERYNTYVASLATGYEEFVELYDNLHIATDKEKNKEINLDTE